ncbi:hypothetical protein JX266_013882 [Neoarthrinium moseri]|nr:hypothetical protein JX266_013882 [Neoarthrinium moseri]
MNKQQRLRSLSMQRQRPLQTRNNSDVNAARQAGLAVTSSPPNPARTIEQRSRKLPALATEANDLDFACHSFLPGKQKLDPLPRDLNDLDRVERSINQLSGVLEKQSRRISHATEAIKSIMQQLKQGFNRQNSDLEAWVIKLKEVFVKSASPQVQGGSMDNTFFD